MADYPSAVLFAASFLVFIFFLLKACKVHPRAPLPPGPPQLPLIGNLFDLPKNSPRTCYRELSRIYGNIMYFRVLGRSIIVLNDEQTAIDLLEKRSAIYSSRVYSPVIPMIALDWSFGAMPYNDSWRHHRRLFSRYFNSTAVTRYRPIQRDDVHRLLLALLDSPERHREHIHHTLGALVIKATYGLDSGELNNKYIKIMESGVAATNEFLSNASILEYIPLLARLPRWLPGTGVVRRVAQARATNLAVRESAWDDAMHAQHDTSSTDEPPSMVQSVIAEFAHDASEDAANELRIAQNVAALCYAGQCICIMAMVSNPNAQRKAQAELDTVVGHNRLPEMEDRDDLPYVNAIVKEAMRWHTAVPLGIAHMSTADDEYQGYFIPKNTMVIANSWQVVLISSMLHDPETFPEPDQFIPERFLKDGRLDPDAKDPTSIAFGFGRRECPGTFLADATVFLFIASILHTFDISPPLDDSGKPIHVELRGSDGLTSMIEDCRCMFKVRSLSAEELLQRLR
ncbi:cytochrome P450 [Earliella scabrosa]|nr:cytochrome P450 [Earliella scabrosa]